MDESTTDDLRVEAPVNLLPDLSDWGLEEVERGVVENNYENRKIIREHSSTYIPVFTTDGRPTNYIQVVTPDMKTTSLTQFKSALLTDPDDPNSEYLTGYDLILDPDMKNYVPMWVLASTREWLEIERERQRRGPDSKPYRPSFVRPPSRCRAHRMDGNRCQRWANGSADMDGLCSTHINRKAQDPGNIGPNSVARARNRIMEASIRAVDVLEELMEDATSEVVRKGAADSLLDRAGLRGVYEVKQEVEVKVSADEIVRARLAKFRENALKAQKLQQELERKRNEENVGELEVITVEAEDVD